MESSEAEMPKRCDKNREKVKTQLINASAEPGNAERKQTLGKRFLMRIQPCILASLWAGTQLAEWMSYCGSGE